MVDPLWFLTLAETEQRVVFRAICRENGWYWPQVAKLARRGPGDGPNRLTASQRSQQGKMASHSSWARTVNPPKRTANARAAFLARFEREVDPEGQLPAKERIRRAEQRRRAYFQGLALKSSLARSRPPNH